MQLNLTQLKVRVESVYFCLLHFHFYELVWSLVASSPAGVCSGYRKTFFIGWHRPAHNEAALFLN